MDWLKIKTAAGAIIVKYKYPLLILLLGIILLLLPAGNKEDESSKQEVIISEGQSILDDEERLATILSMVDGAGKVKVLLTVESGEETLYQYNQQITSANDSIRTDTVTVTDSERNEQGLVQRINPPVYRGAIIVCEGAEQQTVRLSIVQAVSNATGLGADKITVLKMNEMGDFS